MWENRDLDSGSGTYSHKHDVVLPIHPSMFDPVMAVLLLALIGGTIRWRHPIMSLVAIIGTLILLVVATDLGPVSRRVLDHPQRIEIGPEGHKRLASDYASGVIAMKRAADDELRGIALPAATLALLAALGLFRSRRNAPASEEPIPKA